MALAFGFEGRYRVLNDGKAQLDSLRARLSQMLRGANRGRRRQDALAALGGRAGQGGAAARRAADVGRGVARRRWCCSARTSACGWSLNNASDPVFATLQGLDVKAAGDAAAAAAAASGRRRRGSRPSSSPRSTQGLVQVRDLADRSIVIIKGDGFFEPGSAVISDRVLPLLARIAEGLKATPGTVLDHRPHRQPADPLAALSVQLASVAGARRLRSRRCSASRA